METKSQTDFSTKNIEKFNMHSQRPLKINRFVESFNKTATLP